MGAWSTAFLKDETPIKYILNKIRGDMSEFKIEINLDGVEDIMHDIKGS